MQALSSWEETKDKPKMYIYLLFAWFIIITRLVADLQWHKHTNYVPKYNKNVLIIIQPHRTCTYYPTPYKNTYKSNIHTYRSGIYNYHLRLHRNLVALQTDRPDKPTVLVSTVTWPHGTTHSILTCHCLLLCLLIVLVRSHAP